MKKTKRHVLEGLCAVAVLIAAVLTFGHIYGQQGHVSGAASTVGTSEIFAEAELNDAVTALLTHFETNFKGCTLYAVTYDEARAMEHFSGRYKDGNTVVLFTDFYAPRFFGASSAVNFGGRMRDISFVLRRGDSGGWQVADWGYL